MLGNFVFWPKRTSTHTHTHTATTCCSHDGCCYRRSVHSVKLVLHFVHCQWHSLHFLFALSSRLDLPPHFPHFPGLPLALSHPFSPTFGSSNSVSQPSWLRSLYPCICICICICVLACLCICPRSSSCIL